MSTAPLSLAPDPVILISAPNGARRTHADHPAIPLTSAELARCAADCLEAGASILHLHVRGADGTHLLDADAYRDAIAAIRQQVGERLVIQITTEAVGRYSPAEQRAVVRATRPEAVSIALREFIPDRSHESAAAELFADLHQQGCLIQPILYAPAEVIWLGDLIRRGLIPDGPLFPLFVLGRHADGQRSTPTDAACFIDRWQATQSSSLFPRPWSLCAFGPEESASTAAALCLGGHPRVGFENNLWRPDGSLAASPAEPLQRLAEVARLLARPLATADHVRSLLAP